MKKILLPILLFVGANAHAQYFQRYFNEMVTAQPPRAEAFDDGLKSRVNFAGGVKTKYYFAATGYSELSPAPGSGTDARLRLMRSNISGGIGVNAGYQFGDQAPLWFESRGKSICEVDNGAGTGGYVIVGEVNNNPATGATGIPGGTDMFFGTFSTSGTPTLRERIDVGKGADVALCVRPSVVTPGTYLVCGYSVKGTITKAVVARISGAGTVLWLRALDIVADAQCGTTSKAIATSLCEDPFSGNIYVCGRITGHKVAAPNDQDGLVFALSGAGVPLWQVFHDLGGYTDDYRDIKFTSTKALLVCGFSNIPLGAAGPFNDVWLSLFDPALMPATAGMIWSSKHRFAVPLHETKGFRVIEGKNAVGGSRYYVVGPAYPTAGAASQMMLEVSVGAAAGGVFHVYQPPYGPLGFDDRFGLDSVETSMPSPGLIIFSSTVKPITGTQSDSYLLKTYYNGATCTNLCDVYPDNITGLTAHVPMGSCKDTVFKVKKMKYVTYKYDSATICSLKKVGCGNNNTPVADVQQASSSALNEMSLKPNPAAHILNITVPAAENGSYTVNVLDINGRVMLFSVVHLSTGVSSVNINVGSLRKGFYMLRLTGNGKMWTKQFMKE